MKIQRTSRSKAIKKIQKEIEDLEYEHFLDRLTVREKIRNGQIEETDEVCKLVMLIKILEKLELSGRD